MSSRCSPTCGRRDGGSQGVRRPLVCEHPDRRLHRPNSLAYTRSASIFPHPARRPHDLHREIHLRPLPGIVVDVDPFEPEWEGHVTLEISNTTPLPARISTNEGLAQVVFFLAADICETGYADRAGESVGQRGITIPRL